MDVLNNVTDTIYHKHQGTLKDENFPSSSGDREKAIFKVAVNLPS
jgi:hypothetical protein